MKRLSFILVITFFCNILLSQTPSWSWLRSAEGSLSELNKQVIPDQHGNVIVLGDFNSLTVNINGSTLNLSSGRNFLAKYDSTGNLIWVKNDGINCFASSIICDVDGSIYMTGSFNDTARICNTQLTGAIQYGGIFIAKYDANGNPLWARNYGDGLNESNGITLDSDKNIYITGGFQSHILTIGNIHLAKNGISDIFISKFDSVGNPLWLNGATGGSNLDFGTYINTDNLGNIIVTGQFSSPSIAFGGFPLVNGTGGSGSMFIVKYDSFGNTSWAKSVDVTSAFRQPFTTCIDENKNIYVTGYFQNSNLTFAGKVVPKRAGKDIFIFKYRHSGDEIWSKVIGGDGSERGIGITVDSREDIYITGDFTSDTLNFGLDNLTPYGGTGYTDVFVAKYDSSGSAYWAISAGGESYDGGKSICINRFDQIFVSGDYHSGFSYFDNDTLVNNHYPTNFTYNLFIGKIDPNSSPTSIKENPSIISSLHPNPLHSSCVFRFNQKLTNATLSLWDSKGKLLRQEKFNGNKFYFQRKNLSTGVYFVQVFSPSAEVSNLKLVIH